MGELDGVKWKRKEVGGVEGGERGARGRTRWGVSGRTGMRGRGLLSG